MSTGDRRCIRHAPLSSPLKFSLLYLVLWERGVGVLVRSFHYWARIYSYYRVGCTHTRLFSPFNRSSFSFCIWWRAWCMYGMFLGSSHLQSSLKVSTQRPVASTRLPLLCPDSISEAANPVWRSSALVIPPSTSHQSKITSSTRPVPQPPSPSLSYLSPYPPSLL